jgi:TetR/AcrR family transcriptional regulator, transcriptional repressor for nem operon
MGRTPIVDRDTALDAITRRFWAHGYEATSIDDLLGATRMHRGSFYRSFGDKRQAFMAALDHYVEVSRTDHVVPALEGRGSPVRRLMQLLYVRLDIALGLRAAAGVAPGNADGPPGCLLVNTAVELAPHDAAAETTVADALGAMRAALAVLVDAAAELGEVPADVDRGPAVDQVFTVLQGVNVLARAGGDRRHLRGVLTGAVRTALRPTVPLP